MLPLQESGDEGGESEPGSPQWVFGGEAEWEDPSDGGVLTQVGKSFFTRSLQASAACPLWRQLPPSVHAGPLCKGHGPGSGSQVLTGKRPPPVSHPTPPNPTGAESGRGRGCSRAARPAENAQRLSGHPGENRGLHFL